MAATNIYALSNVPAPAASSSVITVPREGILKGAHALFVTDVTVGVRTPVLEIRDGATVLARFVAGATQIASLTGRFQFGGSLDESAVVQGALRIAMAEMPVLAGWTINFLDTADIASTDSARLAAVFQD